jgi:hypothetical protein
VLDLALAQVLRNALLVTAGRIQGKPARRPGNFPGNPRPARSNPHILDRAISQGFAILTWVKYFTRQLHLIKPTMEEIGWGRMKASASIHFSLG